jgi:hypothetical protein
MSRPEASVALVPSGVKLEQLVRELRKDLDKHLEVLNSDLDHHALIRAHKSEKLVLDLLNRRGGLAGKGKIFHDHSRRSVVIQRFSTMMWRENLEIRMRKVNIGSIEVARKVHALQQDDSSQVKKMRRSVSERTANLEKISGVKPSRRVSVGNQVAHAFGAFGGVVVGVASAPLLALPVAYIAYRDGHFSNLLRGLEALAKLSIDELQLQHRILTEVLKRLDGYIKSRWE